MKRIYFLHGFMGTGQTHFEPQLTYFKTDYDVILLDLPGHGASETDAAADYIDQATEYVLEQMKKTGPGYLVGLSLGASLSLQIALQAPTLVAGVVLTGYTPDVPEELTDIMAQQYTYFLEIDQHQPDVAEQFAALHGNRWKTTMQHVLYQMTFRYPVMTKETLADLTIPLHILNGTDQAYEVDGASRMQKDYPATEIDLIADAGHTANLDQPESFNKRLEQILSRSY